MRGVVRCDHCGAPHRREAASTRFRCDWCGGDNRVQTHEIMEELILAADDHTKDPATRVREALGSRGFERATLTPRPARWIGIWQVVNDDGEEFTAPVTSVGQDDAFLRTLPAGPLQGLAAEAPAWVSDLPPRPDTDHDSRTIVEAARADFDSPEANVVLVRLVWIGIQEFMVGHQKRGFAATQIIGTDRVLFESLPSARTMPAPVTERLAAFAVFAAGALILGVLVQDSIARLAFELGWISLGAAFWIIRRDAGVIR
ncbi:hypothetical protein DRQ32_01435 [bacterium]|nr:MAG: hypothetical protein DRQ32_01435 [bacterium]